MTTQPKNHTNYYVYGKALFIELGQEIDGLPYLLLDTFTWYHGSFVSFNSGGVQ